MFFLTQSNTTTVNVNLTCCHPGYRYGKGSQTCLPDGGYIVRPDARNRYVYLQVEDTHTFNLHCYTYKYQRTHVLQILPWKKICVLPKTISSTCRQTDSELSPSQPEIYAEVRDGNLLTSVMPPAFQKCTREGTLTGCLFKFDSPVEQCEGNRTGS